MAPIQITVLIFNKLLSFQFQNFNMFYSLLLPTGNNEKAQSRIN